MDRWRVLQQALENAPVFVAMTRGPKHEIVYTNRAYRALYGEAAGPAAEAYPDLVDAGLIELLDEVYAQGVTRGRDRVPVTVRPPEGGSVPHLITFTYSPVRRAPDGPVEGVLAIAVDVTDGADEVAAAQAAAAANVSARLERVARILIGAARIDDVLREVRDEVTALLGPVRFHLAVADSDLTTLLVRGVGDDGGDGGGGAPVPFPVMPIDASAPVAEAARMRRVVAVPTPEALLARYQESRLRALALQGQEQAWIAVPMLDGEQLVGVLRLAFPHPRTVTEAELGFLRGLASLCALAWQRVALLEELEKASEALATSELRYRTLSEASSLDVWRAAPNGELLSDIPHWRAFTGAEPAAVTGEGWLQDVHPDDRERAAQVWMDAVRTGQRYDSTYRIRTTDSRWRHIHATGVAVRGGGSPDGEIIEWVGTTADVTDELVAERQVQAAAAYASALSAAVTSDDVMRVLAEITSPALGAVTVALAWQDAARLHVRASGYGDLGEAWDYPADVPAEQSVMPLLIRTMRSVVPSFVRSPEELARYFEGEPDADRALAVLDRTPATCWAFLPIAAGGRVVGALALGFADAEEFRQLDREFLYGVASQHGSALERARLYETEHNASLILQRALQPGRPPAVPWLDLGTVHQTSPGADVGGDWAEVLPLPSPADAQRVALVVGDVMGRGLQAAASMGNIRAAVRALAATDPSPASVLAGLDRLFGTFADDVLITCWYGLLSPDGTLHHVNAGHPPPVVVEPGGGTRLLPAAEGWPLGVVGLGPRPVRSGRLEAGETLLVYSDGLVETPDVSMDDGLAELHTRAAQVVGRGGSASCWAEELVAALTARGTDDDATLLVARRWGAPSG